VIANRQELGSTVRFDGAGIRDEQRQHGRCNDCSNRGLRIVCLYSILTAC
jgi:hypothetical protein